MAPDALLQITKLRDEVFETITVLTNDREIDVESSQIVDRLQVVAYEIGQFQQLALA